MGIYDREYVRVGPHSRSGLGNLRFISINTWIILINVAVFLLNAAVLTRPAIPVYMHDVMYSGVQGSGQVVPDPLVTRGEVGFQQLRDAQTGVPVGQREYRMMPPLEAFGHFSTTKVIFGLEVWRFITFQFLHASLSHIFFNMFGLWIFGGMVEQYLGSKRYLAFYLMCGLCGGLAYLILNVLGAGFGLSLPGVLGGSPSTPLVGASAGVFGVIVASAYIAPEAIVQLLFPPIPLKLKYLAYAYVGIAVLNLLRSGPNAGGDAAHLGGAIAGYFFIRNAHLLHDFFEVLGPRKSGRGGRGGRPEAAARDHEVDRILAKVSAEGIHSLTDREKRVLRQASEGQRMAR